MGGGQPDRRPSPRPGSLTTKATTTCEKVPIMRIPSTSLTSLLGAGALAVALVAAPSAAADPDGTAPTPPQPHQACTSLGGNVCQSPGNTQVNDAPPPVQFYPYGGNALLL
jgi:hypothetical protein